jgi:hypothetical protein
MFVGSRARPVSETDNLTVIYEPIVYTMWHPRHFKSYGPPTACCGDNFILVFSKLHTYFQV